MFSIPQPFSRQWFQSTGSVVLIILILGFLYWKVTRPYQYALLGQSAPRIVLTTLEGKAIPIGEEIGNKVVVLNFWATWCPPCRRELPEFSKLATQFPNLPVAFHSVAVDEEIDLISSVVNEIQPRPPVAYDEGGRSSSAYQVELLPTTVLIDQKGMIRNAWVGYTDETIDVIRREIEALIAGTQR